MIRPTKPDDTTSLMALAKAIGLFSPPELEEFNSLVREYFDGNLGENHFWITYDNYGLIGSAYYAPEPFADGTWNLYFIAVHPDYQRQGYGAKILQYVEQTLAKRGERILLIETSGLPHLEGTRMFYRQQGYEEEARIREFYKAAEDKIIFRKALTHIK